MTAMENKVCEKEVGAAQGWTISFPTFLVVDCLDSWVAREAVPETEAGEEERTWFTHSSKSIALTIDCLQANILVWNLFRNALEC